MMISGKIYFFTASILNWKQILIDDNIKHIILNSLKFLAMEKAIKVYGFVIMPNHIHLIWMPLYNKKFKNTQLSFMRFTAQKIKFHLQEHAPRLLEEFLVNKADRKYQIWQRSPLAIELYTPQVFEQKLDYLHNNPVQGKWMLSGSPIDYKWSSSRFYEDHEDEFDFLSHYKDDI